MRFKQKTLPTLLHEMGVNMRHLGRVYDRVQVNRFVMCCVLCCAVLCCVLLC
jgi:hypothetical protein